MLDNLYFRYNTVENGTICEEIVIALAADDDDEEAVASINPAKSSFIFIISAIFINN